MSLEQRHADRSQQDTAALALRAEVEHATRVADRLPAPLGVAVRDLFAAVQPFTAGDGHRSVRVVGALSPEVLQLARAVITVADRAGPESGPADHG
jgi:hypothetical protein